MKNSMGAILIVLLAASASSASTTYTTSRGAVFTQVEKGWQDPSGMIWGANQGSFTNVSLKPDQNGTITDSPATETCAKIGGLLPTEKDFERFSSYFDYQEFDIIDKPFKPQILTSQGKNDMYVIFPELKPTHIWSSAPFLWSSTVSPGFSWNGGSAYYFGASDGLVGGYNTRKSPHSVRCVFNTVR
jgi:hypothetical protein